MCKEKQAISSGNIDGFFANLKSYSPSVLGTVNKEKMLGLVEMIKSMDQGRKIGDIFSPQWGYLYEAIRKKRESLCRIPSEQVFNPEQARRLLRRCPYNGLAFRKVAIWWIHYCQTYEEIMYIDFFLSRMEKAVSRPISRIIILTLSEREKEIISWTIPGNTKKSIAKGCYLRATEEQGNRVCAFKNWLSLCKTKDDFREALRRAEDMGDTHCAHLARAKI